MSHEHQPGPGGPDEPDQGGTRRTFLCVSVGALGAAIAAISVVPALGFVLYPLDHSTTSGGDEFLPAGKRRNFAGNKPMRVELFADRVDAWNRIEQVKVGSCWVFEQRGELVALSTVCPHLGCAVDFDSAAEKFKCPCHRSAFAVDGTVEDGPAPRPLDRLDVQETDGLVSIRYRRFRQGVPEKEQV